MSIIQKIKILLKINSEYKKVKAAIEKEESMGNKKWYQSKTIWAIVFDAAVGIAQSIDPTLLGTPIAAALIALATAFGIYGRVSANKTIQ